MLLRVAAQSVSKIHPQLAAMDVTHVTRVDPPEGFEDSPQLPLT